MLGKWPSMLAYEAKNVKICGKAFADEVKSVETTKVIPFESFAVYGIINITQFNYLLNNKEQTLKSHAPIEHFKDIVTGMTVEFATVTAVLQVICWKVN